MQEDETTPVAGATNEGSLETLTDRGLKVLQGLESGAATPVELELRVGLVGERVEEELKGMLKRGLVRARPVPGVADRDVYFLSTAGRRLVSGR